MNKNTFKILVVDDEKHNIDILDEILSPSYDILIAKNGNTAIQIANEFLPDLILLDVILPDMTGFDVLTILKNSDTTKMIPVIFITGLVGSDDENKGLQLGAVDYITKPFCKLIVETRVKTHLQIVEHIRTIESFSLIDVLTNIPNRRSFNNQLYAEWARATREKIPVSLLMFDTDKFKYINDTYGHPQGDAVLKIVAETIKQTLKRPTDFAARWGGEEFAVLLSNTDLQGALEIAEQIRANIECTVIPCFDGTTINSTVSVGVNSQIPDKNSSVEAFISETDKALYAAKNAGRNRINSANPTNLC